MKENIVLANESLNKWCETEGIDYYEGIESLGNLFKWAVPKLPYVVLENCQAGYRASVSIDMRGNPARYDKDPALALFWAIWEVINAH